jgi:inorganic phosphate transporter, PiT family
VDIAPAQGMAAQSASAAVILASSHLGFALSTTHVATGSVLGSGVGRPGAHVRWRMAGRLILAWMITLPAAGVVGAAMWWIGHLVGGVGGAVTVFVLLIAASAGMWWRSRRLPVGHHNVNDEWAATTPPATPADDRVPATAAS